MPGQKIRLPYPHIGQRTVRREARRLNWLSAGRRWRKTTLIVAVAVENAARGGAYLWTAPTFDQVRIGWNETRRACGAVAHFTQQRMTAEFPGGGTIIYRSLDDPDNARGHTADGVVIDEVGDVKPQAWYEVLRPMLIDTGGWVWGIGTPRGRNWFWREWMAAADREDSMAWQVPTVGCKVVEGRLVRVPHPLENPDIPFSEIEHIYATTPLSVFRQEILAEFLENEGAVFRNIGACLGAPLDAGPERHAGHNIIAGLDLAKQQDYTAISAICVDCRIEVARDRFNQIDYIYQMERIKAFCRRWHVRTLIVDETGVGSPIVEQLQRDLGHSMGVRGFLFTPTTKSPLIESLALAFEREECQWQADPVWTGELEAYERKVSPVTGRSQYNAPAGMHDDTVIARALAWQGVHDSGPLLLWGD